MIKGILATAAALTCCMGIQHSAKSAPAWMTLTAKDHCEYLALGVPHDQAMQMALNDNSLWVEEIKTSYAISNEGTVKAYILTMLRACPNEVKKLDQEIKSERAREQQKAQREFKQFYRSTSNFEY